jgi:hypothetical protein
MMWRKNNRRRIWFLLWQRCVVAKVRRRKRVSCTAEPINAQQASAPETAAICARVEGTARRFQWNASAAEADGFDPPELRSRRVFHFPAFGFRGRSRGIRVM